MPHLAAEGLLPMPIRDGRLMKRSALPAPRHLDYVMEQPCKPMMNAAQLRRRIDLPMKLDECITDMGMVHRVIAIVVLR